MPCPWDLVSVLLVSSFPLASRAPWLEVMDVGLLINKMAASKGRARLHSRGPRVHEGGSPAWARRKELAVEAEQGGEGEGCRESIQDGGFRGKGVCKWA